MKIDKNEKNEILQPLINIGIVGHVDHGKTTLTKLLSGKWTDTHSEEKKKGITIKLGYTNFNIYFNKKNNIYTTFSNDNEQNQYLEKYSIVDAPGHESFMATMISGAAIMDYGLLLIAANEKCPQAQTIEHLKTLEISGVKKIIVVQNKIDLVSKEEAIENYKEIKNFLEGTFAENSPIIPVSAQFGANFTYLLKYINLNFKKIDKNTTSEPHMFIVRSFDINKPGEEYKNVSGGVIGGSLKQGILKVEDEIEIRPGFMKNKDGKTIYLPIYAKIKKIKSDKDEVTVGYPGGSLAIMTELDNIITKSDSLVGQIAGLKGTLPEPLNELVFDIHLFDKVITSSNTYDVKPIIQTEPLMLIVNSLTTVGVIIKVNPKTATIKLKRPVMAFNGDRIVLFRRFDGNKWRIVGYGVTKL